MRNRINSKTRRHSGRETTVIYNPKECPYEITFWNDWDDYRDGTRNGSDRTLIKNKNMFCADYFDVEKYNKKNKILVNRRKVKKNKFFYF